MERKDNYKEKRARPYGELGPFLEKVVSFGKDGRSESIINSIDRYNFGDSRVWSLFGSNDNENWDCLQVAQSKNVLKETKCGVSLAKYWVLYSSGVDGQAILVFLERDQ